jgi:hypothetical protein
MGARGNTLHINRPPMSSTHSRSIGRRLAILALICPVTTAVAQYRPLTIVGGVGTPSVSGSLAGSGRPTWMFGLGTERRVTSAVALAVDLMYEERGGALKSSALFESNNTISFSTIGLAPTARFHLRGRRSSFAPVVSSGVHVWKAIGCSVDYESDFGSGSYTEGCSDYAPDGEVQSPGPLEKLGHASGATLLLGLGLSNDLVAFDLRAERRLGDGARMPNGTFAFGNTVSVMARFRPDFRRRITPK